MIKKNLSTGEFAKLCGVSKDTLFHYDRAGILKPKHIAANGYRCYRAEQFFEFDLIYVLKEAGSTVKEIKNYITCNDPEDFLSILEDKADYLRDQQIKLAQRKKSLNFIIEVARSALSASYGVMVVEACEEERIIAEEQNLNSQELPMDNVARYLSSHFAHCDKLGLTTIIPLCSIISQNNLEAADYTESHFFSTVDKPTKSNRAMVKPAGTYATMIHKGSYNQLLRNIPKMLAKIKDKRLTLNGPAYIYSLLNYVISETEDNDIQKITLKVSGLLEE